MGGVAPETDGLPAKGGGAAPGAWPEVRRANTLTRVRSTGPRTLPVCGCPLMFTRRNSQKVPVGIYGKFQ